LFPPTPPTGPYPLSLHDALPILPKSETSPMRIEATSCCRRSRSAGQMFEGAYTREAAEHFWPWYSKEPRTIAVASASTSAEGWRSEEHTSELQSPYDLVCRLLLE